MELVEQHCIYLQTYTGVKFRQNTECNCKPRNSDNIIEVIPRVSTHKKLNKSAFIYQRGDIRAVKFD